VDVVACLLSYVGVRLPPLFSGVGSFGVESTIVSSAGNCSILSASSCECDNVGSAFCRKNDVGFSIYERQGVMLQKTNESPIVSEHFAGNKRICFTWSRQNWVADV